MMTFASTVRPAQQREVITLQSRLALVLAAALIAAVAPAAQASDVFSGDVSLSSLPRRAASRPDVLTLVLSPTKRNYRVNLPPMKSSAFGRRINTFEVPIHLELHEQLLFRQTLPVLACPTLVSRHSIYIRLSHKCVIADNLKQ